MYLFIIQLKLEENKRTKTPFRGRNKIRPRRKIIRFWGEWPEFVCSEISGSFQGCLLHLYLFQTGNRQIGECKCCLILRYYVRFVAQILKMLHCNYFMVWLMFCTPFLSQFVFFVLTRTRTYTSSDHLLSQLFTHITHTIICMLIQFCALFLFDFSLKSTFNGLTTNWTRLIDHMWSISNSLSVIYNNVSKFDV